MPKKIEFILVISLFTTLSALTWTPIFGEIYMCAGYGIIVYCLYRYDVTTSMIICPISLLLACFLTGHMTDLLTWILVTLVFLLVEGSVVKVTKNGDPVIFLSINMLSCCFAEMLSIVLVKSKLESIEFGGHIADYILPNTYIFAGTLLVTMLGIPLCHITDLKRIRKEINEEWEKQ